jgi:hypothetical protein
MIKSRMMRWEEQRVGMGKKKNVHRLLVGKPEGTRLLGRPRHRLLDNFKTDLGETGRAGSGCRYNNFRKIKCILLEDGLTEPKHVAIKRTSYKKGCIKSVAWTVFIVTSITHAAGC